jgi:hypothetical protein
MHDVVSEVLKNTIRKKLFPVDKSNNYFLLFIRCMSVNEKNIAENIFVSFSFLEV